MTTWNEIVDIKLDKLKSANSESDVSNKASGCFKGCFQIIGIHSIIVFGIIALFGVSYLAKSEDTTFENFNIGQEITHESEMGNIELYQLGEKKLSQNEQKKTQYKETTVSQFERTNTVSEKYFIDNKTSIIGKVVDTVPMTDGHLWLEVELDKGLYTKPINFVSDKFTKKLKVEKSYIMTDNLEKDFYIRVCNVDKGE